MAKCTDIQGRFTNTVDVALFLFITIGLSEQVQCFLHLVITLDELGESG